MSNINSLVYESLNTSSTELKFIPGKGTNLVQFGESRETIQKNIKHPVQEFKKTPNSKNTTDSFDNLGIHIYYDSKNKCVSIECFDDSNLSFQGKFPFQMSCKNASKWLLSLDSNSKLEKDSITSSKFGISLYSSNGIDSNDKLESILLFK